MGNNADRDTGNSAGKVKPSGAQVAGTAKAHARQKRRDSSSRDTPKSDVKALRRSDLIQSSIQPIRNVKEVPLCAGVLTEYGAEFEVSEQMREEMILLLVADENRINTILLSTVKMINSGHALALKNRAIDRGYNVDLKPAESTVVRMLYESYKENRSEVEKEELISNYQREFANLLAAANADGVSDIHIEVRRETAKVRFRINGNLVDYTEWSVRYAREMGQVIYSVIAEEKDVTFNPDRPQDAVIDQNIGDVRVRVRLATMPAYPDGFDMVMRLLPMGVGGEAVPLEKLGYTDSQVSAANLAVSKPVGVTVIAGTTGSGKSTSLKNMLLKKIASYAGMIKVITVEDPPEYFISGATQVPVVRSKNAKDGVNPFAAAIRAAMRSDPDVLMIGEVRDHDSAELLVHAVQSGHQVFTTVHASSAIGIVARLAGIGVKRDVLGGTDFLSGLIYQTLLPVLCDKCKVGIDDSGADDDLKSRLSRVSENFIDSIRFRGKGCGACSETGITGRTVAAEIIIPDNEIMKLIREGDDASALQHWKRNGGKTALHTGIQKMNAGIVDPRDVEHRLGYLTIDLIHEDGVFNINDEESLIRATAK